MRFAQILHGKAHWIFEADEMPDFPTDSEGNAIVLVDITDKREVSEGWLYDAQTGEFSAPPVPEPMPEPEPEPDLKTEYELMNMALLLEVMDKLYTLEEGK